MGNKMEGVGVAGRMKTKCKDMVGVGMILRCVCTSDQESKPDSHAEVVNFPTRKDNCFGVISIVLLVQLSLLVVVIFLHVNLIFPIINLFSTTDRTTTGMEICETTEGNNNTISKGKGKEWGGTMSKAAVKIEGDLGISITIITAIITTITTLIITTIMASLDRKTISVCFAGVAFLTNTINEFDEECRSLNLQM